jgi:hypothetical protein
MVLGEEVVAVAVVSTTTECGSPRISVRREVESGGSSILDWEKLRVWGRCRERHSCGAVRRRFLT